LLPFLPRWRSGWQSTGALALHAPFLSLCHYLPCTLPQQTESSRGGQGQGSGSSPTAAVELN
jgi:hypothetical protein